MKEGFQLPRRAMIQWSNKEKERGKKKFAGWCYQPGAIIDAYWNHYRSGWEGRI